MTPRSRVWGSKELPTRGTAVIIAGGRDCLNAGGTLYYVKRNKD